MKFNVEVELDWIEDDSTIDEEVKNQLVASVVREIQKGFSPDAKKAVEDAKNLAQQTVAKSIDNVVLREVENFLSGVVDVTDEYGDVRGKGVLVRDIIKEKFESALNAKVNDRGKPTNYSGTTRLEYLLSNLVENKVSKETKRLELEINESVKKSINERLKEGMAESVKHLLNVDKILKK